MRLKKLQLIGFKSFADKTDVYFDEGVTCVVGPNGCGKSNISDSIRWVLGERSTKLLRGNKMEDVIFNGTDFRKPLSMAEVSLTIDNSDRGLPIDYNEVTLTRRLYRSGESEYLINKTLCRLKDIQDLILDTGIGSNSYSMIEQGRIDYILRADPDERRFLIEEAAGISKFKVKKDEAIRKLERTEENLLRLNDIVHEVEKNIQYAERQAKRAQKYKEQFEELKRLEICKAFFDQSQIQDEKSKIESERGSHHSEEARLDDEIRSKQSGKDERERALREIQTRYSAEESKRYAVRSRKEQQEQQLRFHQEKRVEIATRRGEIQNEESQLREQLEKGDAEIAEKQQELQSFESENSKMRGELTAAEAVLQEREEQLTRIKSLMDQSKADAFEVAAELTRVKNEYHRLSAFLETSENQKEKIQATLARIQSEKQNWISQKQQLESRVRDLEAKESELDASRHQTQQALKELQTRSDQSEDACHIEERELHELEVRLAMLQNLDREADQSASRWLTEFHEVERGLIEKLQNVISAKPGYEWALEAALGAWAQAWIVNHLDGLDHILERLEQEPHASLAVILKDTSLAQPDGRLQHSLIQHALQDVVEIQPGYESAAGSMVRNIYVVEKLTGSEIRELWPVAQTAGFVSRDGVCLGPLGRIRLQRGQNVEQSVFPRRGEIETIKTALESLRGRLAQARSDEQAHKQGAEQAGIRFSEVQNQYYQIRVEREAAESKLQHAEDRLASVETEERILVQEQDELSREQQSSTHKRQELEQELIRIGEKERVISEKQNSLIRQSEHEEGERHAAMKSAAEKRARLDHLEERNRLIQEAVNVRKEKVQHDRQRIDQLKQEWQRMEETSARLIEEDARIQTDLEDLERQMRDAEVALELIKQQREKAESELAAYQEGIQELQQKKQELSGHLHQADMKLMDLNYQEKSVADRLEQTYQIRLSELQRADYQIQGQAMEDVIAQIEKLQERVKQIGTVNLLAIDEYDELKKRYDFLIGQKTDMERAREELLEAIRKINRTTKSLFEETFQKVQQTFREYYQILFQGGEAKLILLDEQHPLESGVDIVVRPPGKRLQHISLLSGGEKAMTAIALLFALFKIKPSPYCVLDEVDAPLDEANIDRFLSVLQTFLSLSQFIIVTHNRKTISMGDSLYGVTMEEAGVSKIVSVKVGQDEKDAADEAASDSTAAVEEDTVTA